MSEGLVSLRTALMAFVEAKAAQSQAHIKPLHNHIVERLVIEGGFRPEDISPRPPLRIETVGGDRRRHSLVYDESQANRGPPNRSGDRSRNWPCEYAPVPSTWGSACAKGPARASCSAPAPAQRLSSQP